MNRQFSALRGLAIVLVVLYHSIDMGTLAPQGLGYPPIEGLGRYVLLVLHQLGVFAVPTFLFISGSFAAYAAQGNPPKLTWKAIGAGLKRILWPYLFWSILFYIAIYIRRDEEYTFLGYLKNLVVGYPFHFIPLLVFYYTLSPILVHFARRFGGALVVVIALYQLFLINVVFPGSLGFTSPDWARFLAPPVLSYTMAEWGLYFPLGLVYGLRAKSIMPWLQRFRWAFLTATSVFFVLHILHKVSLLHFPLAGHICPLTFALLLPVIKRNSIPMVRQLEEIGKKSYGLYLSHLIVLDFVFFNIRVLVPWVLNHQILLQPLLFILTLAIPLVVMSGMARSPTRTVYHYVFG